MPHLRVRFALLFVFGFPAGVLVAADRERPPEIPTDAGPKEWAEFMDKWGPRPPWHMYRPPHKTVEHEKPDGTVVDVSEKFIEIRKKGEEGTVKYPPHFLLATGRVVVWENDSTCYLLEDVKKGDEVTLCVGTEDKKKGVECFWVKITRRPGGVIPESRKPSDVHPYHIERQAKIDHAEKGTPLPENLQPLPPVKAPKPPTPPMGDPKK